MNYTNTQPHLGTPMPVLLAGCNQEDQALLAQSLKASIPQIKTFVSSRLEQALQHLQTSSSDTATFPRLLVVTLSVSDAQADWRLLQQIKASYRQLPIVVIGMAHQASMVFDAYDAGVNSFLVRSADVDEWKKTLHLLATYWLTVVTLPSQQRIRSDPYGL